MLDLSEIQKYVVEAAEKLDILSWDISGGQSLSTSLSVNKGKIDKIQSSESVKFGIRVMNKDSYGYIRSSDLSKQGLANAIRLAKDIADLKLTDTSPQVCPHSTDKISISSRETVPAAKIEFLSGKLIQMEDRLLKAHPSFEKVPYNGIGEISGENFYLNSIGSQRYSRFQRAWTYLYVLVEQKGKTSRKAFAIQNAENFDNLDTEKCLSEIISKGLLSLDSHPVKTGKIRICFHPKAFLSLLGGFANIWNARRILDGKSLIKLDQVGTDIAHHSFTLVDDPQHAAKLDPVWFDDEGVPATRYSLIMNGRLQGLVHNEETARMCQVRPTGHAISASRARAGNHFLTIESGVEDRPWENEKDLIYVEELHALHSGLSELQGTFSLPVDGEIFFGGKKRSLDSTVISGDIFTVLKNIVHIGQTAKYTTSGYGPEIWVDGLSATGG
jgi:PmbA protein